ncbi:MAG: hypothetical protein KBD76_04785 [Bacteriovorax sp.]|nr:hypothetical protein [Bacteriovorax sp.]
MIDTNLAKTGEIIQVESICNLQHNDAIRIYDVQSDGQSLLKEKMRYFTHGRRARLTFSFLKTDSGDLEFFYNNFEYLD